MQCPASKNRSLKACCVALLAVTLFTGSPVTAEPNPFADRFSGIVLKTQEGKSVRFYEDLLQGKIVMINFMYATCKGR